MATILDTDNVFEYLASLNYCHVVDRDTSIITVISAKNFNLLISFADGKNLLVKQQIHNVQGKTKGEFSAAWQIQDLVKHFPTLGEKINIFLPELLYYDRDNSILVVKYLANYRDLYSYYTEENKFPIEIARSIGQLLATIHSQTFQQREYQHFLNDSHREMFGISHSSNTVMFQERGYANEIINRLGRITPQIFQIMPQDCLQFFKLYQRFPSLSQAIVNLANSITPSCLVHNDLKINNILLDLDWNRIESKIIRLIDWECASWGDPAFDLGSILGSYLEIWLEGLIISSTLSINESLQLANTPLDVLQPSLFTLVRSYLDGFPEIINERPDYIERTIQFAGLCLIQRVEIAIDEERIFDNQGVIILQVAKQLICTPQSAMKTLFGSEFTQFTNQ